LPEDQEAVDAFVATLRNHQEADLRAILGPDAERVISSGDQYADQELRQLFVTLYDEKHAIQQTRRGVQSWMSARTTGRGRSQSWRATVAGRSTRKLVNRRSSTVASAAMS
jgi:hypothetical protein